MLGIGIGMRLVAVCLAGLRKQDEGCGIGCLETEREIEQDKGVDVELEDTEDVEANPDRHQNCLGDEKHWGAKKSSKGLGLQREPIISEDRVQMQVRKVKAEVMRMRHGGGESVRWY